MNRFKKIKEACVHSIEKITNMPKSEKLLFAGSAVLMIATIIAISVTIPVQTHSVKAAPTDPPVNIPAVELKAEEPAPDAAIEHVVATAPIVDTSPSEATEPPEETITTQVEESAPPSNNSSNSVSSESGPKNTWDTYVGRFTVPSVGINVGCYNSPSQATVDAADSAAYYHGYGHPIIADHVNQSFYGLEQTSVGAKATLTVGGNTKEYTCVGKIYGHNTGTYLADANYNSISNYYPGALVTYTCNGDWRDVVIVFFMPDEGNNLYVGSDGSVQEFDDIEQESNYSPSMFCDELGKSHKWGDWGLEWGDEEGTFEWRSRHCQRCPEEDWQLFDLVPDETEPPVQKPETPSTEPPVETTPPDPAPEATVPSIQETEPVVEETTVDIEKNNSIEDSGPDAATELPIETEESFE